MNQLASAAPTSFRAASLERQGKCGQQMLPHTQITGTQGWLDNTALRGE